MWILSFPAKVVSLYVPLPGSYFTNALSSFCNPIPVNCATTIDLNPSALSPSAWRPQTPNTDLRDTLKIYGEAEETVSTERFTLAPVGVGSGFNGADDTLYLNSFALTTSVTTYWPLYPVAVTPLIWMAVSTASCSNTSAVVTVIVVVGVIPSPDLILVIPTSPPVGPTIRNSSILGWISSEDDG